MLLDYDSLADLLDEDDEIAWVCQVSRGDECRCYVLTCEARDTLLAMHGQAWLDAFIARVAGDAKAWAAGGVGGLH